MAAYSITLVLRGIIGFTCVLAVTSLKDGLGEASFYPQQSPERDLSQ